MLACQRMLHRTPRKLQEDLQSQVDGLLHGTPRMAMCRKDMLHRLEYYPLDMHLEQLPLRLQLPTFRSDCYQNRKLGLHE